MWPFNFSNLPSPYRRNTQRLELLDLLYNLSYNRTDSFTSFNSYFRPQKRMNDRASFAAKLENFFFREESFLARTIEVMNGPQNWAFLPPAFLPLNNSLRKSSAAQTSRCFFYYVLNRVLITFIITSLPTDKKRLIKSEL